MKLFFVLTINYLIIIPPMDFMRNNTCNLFQTRTHAIDYQ